MAVQTVSTLNHGAGLNLTTLAVAADAALSDKWLGTGNEMLFITLGATPITLTLTYGVGGTVDGQTLPSKTFSLLANNNYLMGPFPTGLYLDSNGYVNIGYSAVTNVKILVFTKGT